MMNIKRLLCVFCALLCIVSFVSCGSQSKSSSLPNSSGSGYDNSEKDELSYDAYYADDLDYMMMAETSASGNITSASSGLLANRKIVRNVSLNLETKLYDDAVAALNKLVSDCGGYVSSSQTYGNSMYAGSRAARSASFTVRVPASGLDNFINGVEGSENIFNVTDKSESAQDITETYYDAEARLNSLLTQEERLLSMLEGATELQYMLELENTLADVRYQIENYYSQIKRYDDQVAMSTVDIYLNEVIEYNVYVEPPKTFLERLSIAAAESWENFVNGLQDFAIGIVYVLPALIIILVILAVSIIIMVVSYRKRKRRAAAALPAPQPDDVKAAGKDDNAGKQS